MVHVARRIIVGLTLLGLLGACSAVIDQSSFFPRQMAPPAARLSVPTGYTQTAELVPLPALGSVHVVRLDRPGNQATIIYSGGNGAFTSGMSLPAAALAETTGADLILYDYPGRGGTDIPATIDAAIATGAELVAALKTRGWIGQEPLFAYGVSFGGSQAAAMARGGGFNGLILEGTASDIAKVGRNFVPSAVRPFVRLRVDPALARFDYLGYAVAARSPVLLLSSREDRVVTPANMQDFAAQLRERGTSVELAMVPGGHGVALGQGIARKAVQAFVKKHSGAGGQ